LRSENQDLSFPNNGIPYCKILSFADNIFPKEKALSRLWLIVIEPDEKSKPYSDDILSGSDNNFCAASIFKKLFKKLKCQYIWLFNQFLPHTFPSPQVSDQKCLSFPMSNFFVAVTLSEIFLH
jgi:hypothetical protein